MAQPENHIVQLSSGQYISSVCSRGGSHLPVTESSPYVKDAAFCTWRVCQNIVDHLKKIEGPFTPVAIIKVETAPRIIEVKPVR